MNLTEEQLDWLVEHFVNPGKAWVKLPPLEQSLLDLGLIKSEHFPVDSGFDVFVLSLTAKGLGITVKYRQSEVRDYFRMFGDDFLRNGLFDEMSLENLPELLSNDDDRVRDAALSQLDKLLEKTNGSGSE